MSQRLLEYWSRGLTGTPAEVRARAAMRFERWRVNGVDETRAIEREKELRSVPIDWRASVRPARGKER
jgi:hypothetical protein